MLWCYPLGPGRGVGVGRWVGENDVVDGDKQTLFLKKLLRQKSLPGCMSHKSVEMLLNLLPLHLAKAGIQCFSEMMIPVVL